MKQMRTDAKCLGGALALIALLGGCASHEAPRNSTAKAPVSAGGSSAAASSGAASTSGGRYAMSGDAYPVEPPDVSSVPDAEPRNEPRSSAGNRATYQVWGETYHVPPDARGYAKQGTASWYGEKFQGYATANGEIYDMYKMSAAHRSLPLPTYARVTNLDNGREVIVRVNDRGPFHSEREIDLSYAAAARLDILDNGTGSVRVEAIDPQQWQAERGNVAGSAPAASAPRSRAARAATTPAATERRVEASPVPASAPAKPQTVTPAVSSPEAQADNAAAQGAALYLQIAALSSPESAQQLKQQLESELPYAVRVQNDGQVHRVQIGPIMAAQEQQARDELRQAGFSKAFIVR